MKCNQCGAELNNDEKFCPYCGREVNDSKAEDVIVTTIRKEEDAKKQEASNTLRTIAKVFMIIGCFASASLFFIPLLWTVPMTIRYYRNPNVSLTFKICALLFVNQIAGIIMLCDPNKEEQN